jgi:outer membrane cobalamin receptor
MPVLIAALMLGAAVSPPPDDDDQRATPAPPAVVAPTPNDNKEAPRAVPDAQSNAHEADDDEEGRVQASTIVVTAHRLDAARTQIDAGLGATVYSLTNETIENRPGGETGSISDILAQAPGVTLSGNVLNVRGSRANQIRINDVIIPEAISDPADHLSSRLAATTRLMTGTLPAQFGFAPGGVISVTTKNGLYQHGGQAELFAATDGMVEPALEWAGSIGATSLFASGSLEHDHSMVAAADGIAARDRKNEIEGLGFADHVIDDENRLSLIVGGSRERHVFGPTSIGSGEELSSDGYIVGTFQHSHEGFTLQTSLFAGVASDRARSRDSTHERRTSFGTQVDATEAIGAFHALRFGLLATRSSAHELDFRSDLSSPERTSMALYAQDEWKIAPALTVNPGARLEWLHGLSRTPAIEPRASLVLALKSGLTAHAGYARYALAPPLGEERAGMSLRDEQDDYLDAGIQQRIGKVRIGVDGYWRNARNYAAEHETPGSAVPTAFGFKRARIEGLELSATYAHRATTAWANLALTTAKGGTIIGGDGLFAPATIAAASTRFVPLASERPVTLSGGITQRLGKLSLSGDLLASSGTVRTLDLADPNGSRHVPYAVVGLAAVYHAQIAGRPADLRLDLTNLTNVDYATRDATSLEGGWTLQGRGRAITIGIEQGF